MRQEQEQMTFQTKGKGILDITGNIIQWLRKNNAGQGMLTLFVKHTSASLMIQENADPDVLRDIETFFKRLVPEDGSGYRHSCEGPDDMPAHIRSTLTQTQLNVPVNNGRPLLGT